MGAGKALAAVRRHLRKAFFEIDARDAPPLRNQPVKNRPDGVAMAAIILSGRKCASHMKDEKRPGSRRVFLTGPGAFRRLVAVVAPQVLPRALAHQGLERAVEVAAWRSSPGSGGGSSRATSELARAARQPPRVGEKARDALALREPAASVMV